jgi:hypothetical protein
MLLETRAFRRYRVLSESRDEIIWWLRVRFEIWVSGESDERSDLVAFKSFLETSN